MKYYVEVNGRRREVEIPEGSSVERVTVDGRELAVESFRLLGDGQTELIIGHHPFSADLTPSLDRCRVQIGWSEFEVSVVDERSETIHRLTGRRGARASVAGEVRAPMPGLVVKLLAGEGDRVSRGQGVVVVEAMKMENEIPAPVDGVVQQIKVEPGRAVDKGELLLIVKGK